MTSLVRRADGGRLRAVVYHNLDRGGALRAALELINATADQIEYDIVTLSFGRSDRDPVHMHELARPNVRRIKVFDDRSALRHGMRSTGVLAKVADFGAVRSLESEASRWINGQDYDLAIVHPCRITQTPLLLHTLDPPRLFYMHEPRRRSFERNYNVTAGTSGLKRWARRMGQPALELALRRRDSRAATAPALILCNSYFTKEAIGRSYGIDAKVSYLGVNSTTFSLGYGGAQESPYVLSVGGLEPAKGHDFVIDAVSEIATERRPRVCIVHDRELPGYKELLTRRSAEVGVQLDYYSGISDEDLATLYRGAVATICGARLEPFGLTTLESLSCGTPVVAVREGGFREVLRDGCDGYLVDREPAAAARSIERILEGQLPGDRVARAQWVEGSWSWTAAGDRFVDQVARLLGQVAVERRTSGADSSR